MNEQITSGASPFTQSFFRLILEDKECQSQLLQEQTLVSADKQPVLLASLKS